MVRIGYTLLEVAVVVEPIEYTVVVDKGKG